MLGCVCPFVCVHLCTVQIVTDGDLEALLSDEVFQPKTVWRLADLQVRIGHEMAMIGDGRKLE